MRNAIERDLKANPKQFWSFVNNKPRSSIPDCMSYDNFVVDEQLDIVNAVRNLFSKHCQSYYNNPVSAFNFSKFSNQNYFCNTPF